jgi:hypothetical protein
MSVTVVLGTVGLDSGAHPRVSCGVRQESA